MNPAFTAALRFLGWERAHPDAPEPVRRMTRDEHAAGHDDFEHWYAALSRHVEF